jgi:ribosomal protein L24E
MIVEYCYHCGKKLEKPLEHDFYDVFCSAKCERAYLRIDRSLTIR